MSISINADSPGERIVVALAILTLCGELWADNGACSPTPAPMTVSACVELCESQDTTVRRVEDYACECQPAVTDP